MRTVAQAPPGALLVTLLGGCAGGVLGFAVFGAVWMASMPGRTAAESLAHVLAISPWPLPQGYFTLGGAATGFLAVGAFVRNRLAMRLLGAVGRTALLALGCLVGIAFGGTIYAVWQVAGSPHASLRSVLEHLIAAIGGYRSSATPFVLAGFFAGLVGAIFAVGRGAIRVGFRIVVGGVVGALAGLIIFSLAYVLVAFPGIPQDSAYALHFAEAVRSAAPSEFLFVGLGTIVGVLLSSYSWRLYGILTFVSLLFVILGYILYSLTVTLPHVPSQDVGLSETLFAAELASLLMVLLYSFYTIDVAARKKWRRTTDESPFSPYYLPKVAIHVPTYNEPFELVRETLQTLLDMDYPLDRYVIMVGDDSTRPECSEPLKAFCQAHSIAYLHRRERPGYKAGALNALLHWTPADVNLIAVVDADYQVEPEFLRETVGYFIDPDLGWVQTPQDYRNRHESFLTEQYYLADAYFYRTILPSRNEQNSIIFCGTMGMLRKRAIEGAGGWGEKYITEDAEISVRLLNAGWRSLYVNKTFGRGLIPPTFEAYKRQHYRWAFGGGKILRGHTLRFMFGRFTFRQRLDYLVGSLNWFEGAFILTIAFFVLGLGVADVVGVDVVTHHTSEVLLVGLVPLFLLLDGLTRVHLVLRRSINLTFGGTLRILGMWLSVKFSNTRAAMKALLGFSIPFVRTPKAPSERMRRREAFVRAVRLTAFESSMAAILVATAIGVGIRLATGQEGTPVAVGRMFMMFWLTYYALIFAAAPLYAYKSFVTLRPDAGVTFQEKQVQDVNA